MEFTKTTRLKDILNLPCFQPMLGQFIASSAGDWFHGKGELSLAELQQQNPTWYWEDVAYGLNRLQKIALGGGRYVYPGFLIEKVLRKRLKFKVNSFVNLAVKDSMAMYG